MWLRKFLVSLFSALLLLSLVGGVAAYSLNSAFSEPTNSEHWLSQSQFYKQLTANYLAQAVQFTDSNGQATVINANDPIVQQATQSVFNNQLADQTVASFLNGNYQWLKGKTDKPQFKLDFSAQKADFARQVGQATANRLQQLPVCNLRQLQQLAQAQTVDLLSASCRPPSLNPAVEANNIEQQIVDSKGLLANPIITADSLSVQNPGVQPSTPYYSRLRVLPAIYRLAQKLPAIFMGIAIISLVILFLAAQSKRYAWRHLAKTFSVAGLILALAKPLFDYFYNHAQDSLFNTSHTAVWQRSFAEFARSAVDYIAHINLVGGIVYLLIALVIIIGLLISRSGWRRSRPTEPVPKSSEEESSILPPGSS